MKEDKNFIDEKPFMPSQIPKVKLDMRGLVKYAKERGVAPIDFTGRIASEMVDYDSVISRFESL